MSTYEIQWSVVMDLLRQARDELQLASTTCDAAAATGIPHDVQLQFDLFLENNELGLAWDALASLADDTTAPRGVWEKLLLAAGLMSSAEQSHLAATRLCNAEFPTKQAS
jgi:hypothetical protein